MNKSLEETVYNRLCEIEFKNKEKHLAKPLNFDDNGLLLEFQNKFKGSKRKKYIIPFSEITNITPLDGV